MLWSRWMYIWRSRTTLSNCIWTWNCWQGMVNLENTWKYPLRRYILGVLTHTTAWEWHLEDDETSFNLRHCTECPSLSATFNSSARNLSQKFQKLAINEIQYILLRYYVLWIHFRHSYQKWIKDENLQLFTYTKRKIKRLIIREVDIFLSMSKRDL